MLYLFFCAAHIPCFLFPDSRSAHPCLTTTNKVQEEDTRALPGTLNRFAPNFCGTMLASAPGW